MVASKKRVRTNKLRNYWWTRGYISAGDTARVLGVDATTVYRWAEDDKFVVLTNNGHRYLQVGSIAKHMSEPVETFAERLRGHFAREDATILAAQRERAAERDDV